MKNQDFSLTPQTQYDAPNYPTRDNLQKNKLRKLPANWKRNAAVLACIGALGMGVFTGCSTLDHSHHGGSGGAPIYVTQPTEQEAARCADGLHGQVAETILPTNRFDVEVRAHWGGSGAGPWYVAQLTEQEALGIIRNRLCEAGLCFDSPVPSTTATYADWENLSITPSLFDEQTRQAIVFPAPTDIPFMSTEDVLQAWEQDFRRQNVIANFMRNPGETLLDWDMQNEYGQENEPTFTDEEKQAAGFILYDRLLTQVDELIAELQAQGILPS